MTENTDYLTLSVLLMQSQQANSVINRQDKIKYFKEDIKSGKLNLYEAKEMVYLGEQKYFFYSTGWYKRM